MMCHQRRVLSIPKRLSPFLCAALAIVLTTQVVLAQKGPDMDNGKEKEHRNRLADSASPYLRQHADNPVNWYEWGDEAIEKARRENKPIFLSIGYAACHWCHVMERESFSNPDIAKILNEHFVAIKVDREERPDIDAAYMEATVAMTGSGGWPMSVFLTPDDLAPFLSGTYFPPESRHGLPAFGDILQQVANAWEADSEHIKQRGAEIVDVLKNSRLRPHRGDAPLAEVFPLSTYDDVTSALLSNFDAQYGGWGPGPKFPSPHNLEYLLRRHYRTGDEDALRMVERTLREMAYSGIYDQVGGGFHRYTIDREWTTPHFEKMLYDQSQLAIGYLEAWQVTHNKLYARIARETLDYVLRDMRDPSGGFHSSEDADSEGEEGLFYTWTIDEFYEALNREDADRAIEYYRASSQGNFEGRNILLPIDARTEYAQSMCVIPESFSDDLDGINDLLRKYREENRPRPRRDNKVLTAWNARMISAFSKGAQILDDERYANAAADAATFLLSNRTDDGAIPRAWIRTEDGLERLSGPGFLEDYAELALALIDLYETTFDTKWIDQSEAIINEMIDRFALESGGFAYGGSQDAPVLQGRAPAADDATPSPNASAALALLRLGALLDDKDMIAKGEQTLIAFSGQLQQRPAQHLDLLIAAEFALHQVNKVAIVGNGEWTELKPMLQTARKEFRPDTLIGASLNYEKDAKRLPLFEYRAPIDGKPTAYYCEGYTCRRPASTPRELENLLDDSQ